jgi:hypothetical protein
MHGIVFKVFASGDGDTLSGARWRNEPEILADCHAHLAISAMIMIRMADDHRGGSETADLAAA